MAASLVTRKACGAPKAVLAQRTQSPRPISVVSCASQQEAVTPAKFFPQLLSSVMSAGVAASLLLGSVPTAYAAELRTLADVTRPNYGFVDANKDGWISKEEISQMAQQVAEEQEFDAPNDTLVDFSLRVFDLNQDGRLSTEEMLTGLALDGAVGEDVIDADIVKVFDKDGNGLTDLAEWKAPFGSLGPNGEQLKEFAFSRVDFLTDKDQKLDVSELANAVVLMRVMVLGY